MLQTGQSRACSELLPFPTAPNDIHQSAHGDRAHRNRTYPFSKCWLTVSSLVPSLGLMSFQGVWFSFVHTTSSEFDMSI